MTPYKQFRGNDNAFFFLAAWKYFGQLFNFRIFIKIVIMK